jgi:hypothetical protein
MFILEGKPLALDRAFTTPDGTQYPANWLRLATPEQRAAVGITEQSDLPSWDQRYYWGYDAEGNLIPKQLEDLKTLHIQQTKETANTLLVPTDWYIVRKFERNIDVPENIVSYRSDVISVAEERETLIKSVTTVEELKGLYESYGENVEPVMPNWPIL